MPKMRVDLSTIKAFFFRSPVSLIQLIKPALDTAYQRLKAADKDAEIKKSLARLMGSYADLTAGDDIDYSSPVTRFAYIYKYVPSHANLLIQIIEKVQEVSQVLEKQKFSVSALGGGPGTEVLAISKYIKQRGLNPKRIICTVYDRDQGWADSWHNLDEHFDLDGRIVRTFKTFDATRKDTWKNEEAFLESDLFCMVYFVSEVFKHRDKARSYFEYVFKNAKSGALFVFIDNSHSAFSGWFDELAQSGGLETLSGNDAERLLMKAWEEEKKDFGDYHEKFGDPKIKADVCWRVARKP